MFDANQLVHIPSLGRIVSGETILSPITLRYEVRNHFSLQEDPVSLFSSGDLIVDRVVELNIYATILLATDALSDSSLITANEINRFTDDTTLSILKQEDDEEEPKKRRRRKRDEDEDEEDEAAIALRVRSSRPYTAYDILIESFHLEDEESQSPLRESTPFRLVAGLSEKNAEVLPKKLAKLRRAVQARSTALTNLQAGSAPEDEESDLLPPVERDVRSADTAGLRVYEEKLRAEVTEAEETVRNIVTFFNDRVIARANEKAASKTALFVDEVLKIKKQEFTRTPMIQKLFAEELVVINPTSIGKKKTV